MTTLNRSLSRLLKRRPGFRFVMPAAVLTGSASALTVQLSQFGPAGQGRNDTFVFQTAINSTAANSQTLEVPAAAQPYNVAPLTIPSNTHIVLDPGVIVRATSGYGPNSWLLAIDGVNNVSITGTPGQSVFEMQKSQYTSGEYRHCLFVGGSRNITIQGIQCNQSGGDGIYITDGSANITVTNSGFDGNARNGMSVISVDTLLVDNCTFTNTAGSKGLAPDGPWDGIDMEPNSSADQLSNVVIQNSTVSGNAGNGVMVTLNNLTSASRPVSVVVNNVTSSNNRGSGLVTWNGHDAGILAPAGSVLFENSRSTNDAVYGAAAIFYDATGASATFNNITIANPNSSGTSVDGAAFAIKRGGGASYPMGNVTVSNLSVTDTIGTIQNYFTVEDFSEIGVANINIGNFGTLSGARSTGALGILEDQPVDLVSVH